MPFSPFIVQIEPSAGSQPCLERDFTPLVDELRAWFDAEFSVWDAQTGNLLWQPANEPRGDELLRGELCRAAAQECGPQVIDEAGGVVLLALPLEVSSAGKATLVALAAFATLDARPDECASDAARLLGFDERATAKWIERQTNWPVAAILKLATGFLEKTAAVNLVEQMRVEVEQISDNLASTYEEISLLHGLAQNLRISSTDEDLGRQALDWLLECLPAKGVALQYLPVDEAGHSTYKARTESVLLTAGKCPLNAGEFSQLIESLELEAGCGPFVANRVVTSVSGWNFSQVRQVILTPLYEGENLFGWLAAFNHRRDLEFGTVEASLLSSVGALLGIHSGNHELYRQQAEFVANVVRAFTSAIDAKDPYTCGHSDRVARIAVRLAQTLHCDGKSLTSLYMAGLLHDIGKIGIDDNVLRKPGRLTDAEFEHIKLHPELGYKILADLRQLSHAFPVVLHHHEQWNGKGYPHGLAGENIPLAARIVAVADAYDAMTSDRPYRKGMPDSKVDEIFRDGAGEQWDPQVVAAFFTAREDIRAIRGRERANLTLDVQQWA